jgi:hypothetical protein
VAAHALAITEGVATETAGAVETKLKPEPTEEQIRQRAYEIYVLRGYVDGSDQEDWLQAEAELRQTEV